MTRRGGNTYQNLVNQIIASRTFVVIAFILDLARCHLPIQLKNHELPSEHV